MKRKPLIIGTIVFIGLELFFICSRLPKLFKYTYFALTVLIYLVYLIFLREVKLKSRKPR